MYFKDLNLKKYKIAIINDWFFKKLETDFDKYTNLSKNEREIIKKKYKSSNLKLLQKSESQDKSTLKALFELSDGARIESVLMRFKDGRNSVCVSSQVGCPVGCVFCATGRMGFTRNLTAQEIVDQVLFFARILDKQKQKVTNVVYMGMGEPMLNLDNVIESIKILTDKKQFGLGSRHITVSTSGYVKQLYKFLKTDLKVRLAISLHAPTQSLREKLMPVAKIYSLDELFEFLNIWWQRRKKRISFEYILIKNINDSEKDASSLAKLLKNKLAHVNLIPYNPVANLNFQRSNKKQISRFAKILNDANIPVTLRVTMGDEIKAACGQLASKTK